MVYWTKFYSHLSPVHLSEIDTSSTTVDIDELGSVLLTEREFRRPSLVGNMGGNDFDKPLQFSTERESIMSLSLL